MKELELGHHHRRAPDQCPHCGHRTDAATGIGTNDRPDPGDLAVCIRCGGVAIYTVLGSRLPTVEELVEAFRDPRVRAAQRAVKMSRAN